MKNFEAFGFITQAGLAPSGPMLLLVRLVEQATLDKCAYLAHAVDPTLAELFKDMKNELSLPRS
jgi:hypothetical protein